MRHTTKTLRPGFVEKLEDRQLLAAHIGLVTYATIQAAVDAAKPNAVITVDAGQYDELVTITKPLTLRGAKAGIDARSKWRGTGESIVDGYAGDPGERSTAFYVKSSGVTIDGFTVQGDGGYIQYGAGIVIAPDMAGTKLLDNVIRYNTAGIYLANSSATRPAIIAHNLFVNNNQVGENSGRGIYSNGSVAGSQLMNVVIDGNTFQGDGVTNPQDQIAVGLESRATLPQSNITIINNVVDGMGKALLAYNATNLLIQNNTITNCIDSGSAALRFEGGVSNVLIKANSISGGLGAGIRVDCKALDNSTGAFNSSNITIEFNDLYNNAAGEIVVDSSQYVGALDGRFNWFGQPSGPAAGDLSGNVLATPFLTVPATAQTTRIYTDMRRSLLVDTTNGNYTLLLADGSAITGTGASVKYGMLSLHDGKVNASGSFFITINVVAQKQTFVMLNVGTGDTWLWPWLV